MKKIITLILLLSSVSNAQNIVWSNAENAAGYKLHWEIVKECGPSFDNYFRYSVDTGENLSHNIGQDVNFLAGKKYAFKVSAYTVQGIESDQSNAFDCVEVKGLPTEVEKVKADQSGVSGNSPKGQGE